MRNVYVLNRTGIFVGIPRLVARLRFQLIRLKRDAGGKIKFQVGRDAWINSEHIIKSMIFLHNDDDVLDGGGSLRRV